MMHFHIIWIGIQSLLLHKLRSLLTILGVVFGVGSVVSMLAIGEGVSHDMREQLLRMGPDRIIIRSQRPRQAAAEGGEIMTYGVNRADLTRLQQLVPGILAVAETFEIDKDFWAGNRRAEVRIVGTTPDFREIHRLEMQQGRFLAWTDLNSRTSVVVLGAGVARKLFGAGDPLGAEIKHSSGHYRVIGVLRPRVEQSSMQHDPNQSLFAPLPTVKARFEHVVRVDEGGSRRYERLDLHQIGLRVRDLQEMPQIISMIRRLMTEFHPQNDYELVVPYELLKQSEHTKRVFNAVLGSIGSISLLVGGIGIMNIMLATVTERTREIGVRRALGARRRDIILQFLAESVVLSSIGGILGLGLGVVVPYVITQVSDVQAVVTGWSLLLALGISVGVGVVFGVYPARKAAAMEPVVALRYG